jgi:tetratricopeptide (TPR) repeat protein
VFSKEVAFLAPAGFVLVDVFGEWRRDGRGSVPFATWLRSHLERRALLYGGLVALAALIGAVILFKSDGIVPRRGYYDTTGGGVSALDRIGVAGLALRLLFYPAGQTVDYSYDALGVVAEAGRPLFALDVAIAIAGLAALLVGLWRRSWLGFAGAWMVIFYLPHTGIVDWHEIFAERFLYLPAIGLCAAVAAGGVTLARRPDRARAVGLVGGAVVLALAAATVVRNRAWSSAESLWASAAAQYPTCARAHKSLADVYLADARPALAQQHFEEAVRILPTYLEAHVGVAVSEVAQRRYALALEKLHDIQTRWPRVALALNLEGYIQQTLGDSEAAMTAYQGAVDTDPKFADGYNNLARMYVERGEIDEAVRLYKKALEHDPALIPAWRNLATVYREAFQDEEKAVVCEREAERLERQR